jgi:hypothetical protein
MTLVVMFITFITSKAQDACTNNTSGNFLLQLAATSGLLLIADVIAVIQIFNLVFPQRALAVTMVILIAISLIVIRGTVTIPFVSTSVTLFTTSVTLFTPFFTALLAVLAFLASLLTFTLVMFVVLMTSFTPKLTLVLSVSCHG